MNFFGHSFQLKQEKFWRAYELLHTLKSYSKYYNISCNGKNNREIAVGCLDLQSIIVFVSLEFWRISIYFSYNS